jgi:hypothetical protein
LGKDELQMFSKFLGFLRIDIDYFTVFSTAFPQKVSGYPQADPQRLGLQAFLWKMILETLPKKNLVV